MVHEVEAEGEITSWHGQDTRSDRALDDEP
jgi:hypothetical protein